MANGCLPAKSNSQNSALEKCEGYTPPKGSKNKITNVTRINITGDYATANEMKSGYIGTENAATLEGSPINQGPFYAYREVFFIPNENGYGGKTIVRLTEAYPVPGRIWGNAYNADTDSWGSWRAI